MALVGDPPSCHTPHCSAIPVCSSKPVNSCGMCSTVWKEDQTIERPSLKPSIFWDCEACAVAERGHVAPTFPTGAELRLAAGTAAMPAERCGHPGDEKQVGGSRTRCAYEDPRLSTPHKIRY
ncbi:hypothetical protein NDU88_006812 [Pleurodeles waltl]|uniref:Uncharacterized protein n=1 Tax=Pleurodeles waltl TaxID=8319 RepID=A0AAV7U1I6_PLEWA|nr:hypothetical protein NDU88_006812 [Pleurodeles waltl]